MRVQYKTNKLSPWGTSPIFEAEMPTANVIEIRLNGYYEVCTDAGRLLHLPPCNVRPAPLPTTTNQGA